MDLIVSNSAAGPVMNWGAGPRRCAIGPNGMGQKKEGDGKTPIGVFPLRQAFWRADRTENRKRIPPARALVPEDGWCDAPGDPNYNKLVKHPYPVSAEHLWLDSHVYDIIVVVGFNDDPVVQGAGSARPPASGPRRVYAHGGLRGLDRSRSARRWRSSAPATR